MNINAKVILASIIIGNFVFAPFLALGAEKQPDPSQEKKITLQAKAELSALPQKPNYVNGEVLVKFKNNKINLQSAAGRIAAANFIRSNFLEERDDFQKGNISVLKISDGKTIEQKISELKNNPAVEYVQPNFQYYHASINTDDTYKAELWGLDNTGQTVDSVAGVSDADIDAPEAWAISEATTTAAVIVAVIDSGASYNHPDLTANMWDGASCVGNDKNGGAIGGACQHGFDYEDNDKIPLPTNDSHGTHIAGTIAAVKNNARGIIGVAANAKIMAIKSSLTTSEIIKGIDFAQQNGAAIINASWGQYGTTNNAAYDLALYNAIKNFPGLFVAAAGNGGINHNDGSNSHKFYPADFTIATSLGAGLDNIISVAATDQSDGLASFSDYGAETIDVGAPGKNIYSVEGYRIFDEDFESTTPPGIGLKFTQSGSNSWGTILSGSNKSIFGDYANWGNYRNSILSNLDSSAIDLSGKPDSYLNFDVYCDSEDGYDGIILYFWNGSAWVAQSVYDGSVSASEAKSLSSYAISNFQFRFTWLSDESNVVPYAGCFVDNIKVVESDSVNGSYQFMDGTSMAAPHVAGLAALVWGYRPDMDYAEVKNTILTTGDPLSSLAGKTVTGKRINAYNALNSVAPVTLSSIAVTTPATKLSYTVGESLDISGLVVTGTYSDNSTTTEAVVAGNVSGFDSSFPAIGQVLTITIGGKTTTYAIDVVAATVSDSTAPVILLNGQNPVGLYVGDQYVDAGATASDNVDGNITASIVTGGLPIDSSFPGTFTVTYNVSDAAGNPATQVTRTVNVTAAPVTLSSIAVTTPATKLSYTVGESLDISGLVVTGTYSDNSTAVQSVSVLNITGFNSASPATGQVLTITIGGKTTTYAINIVAAAVVSSGGGGGGGGGGSVTVPATVVTNQVLAKSIEKTSAIKMTRAEIISKINEIVALIAQLQAQLNAMKGKGAVAKYSCAGITKNLYYGMKNDPQVKCLQEVLKAQGFAVLPTGDYGAITRTAVIQFQSRYASEILTPYRLKRGSGNVGNATKVKINELIGK